MPLDSDSENTQYRELKKWLPDGLIKRDVNNRNNIMILNDPQGGPEVKIEFSGYNQSVQQQAGKQRFMVWLDENGGKSFYEEQIPRLMAAKNFGYGGFLIMSYTPIPGSSGWEYDDLYNRARIIYRTDAVRERIKLRTGEDFPKVQYTGQKSNIIVFMAATDDNPMFAKEIIDEKMNEYADEDVIDARRYGQFMQLSGKYFKNFTPAIHVIEPRKYFPEGVPSNWKHFRGIDYHKAVPWACSFIMRSPDDEIFVYDELSLDPKKLIVHEMANTIALKSEMRKYTKDLIDPLANETQVNTGFSITQDLNRVFQVLKREDMCTGAFWQGWDTKSRKGYDEVQKRLKNSLLVGKPFNNSVISDKGAKKLPTLWIFNSCREHIESFKNARYDEWANRDQTETKEMKEKIVQRWSHFCMSVECLLKDNAVCMNMTGERYEPVHKRYFEGRG
jgi:hypothetical protein